MGIPMRMGSRLPQPTRCAQPPEVGVLNGADDPASSEQQCSQSSPTSHQLKRLRKWLYLGVVALWWFGTIVPMPLGGLLTLDLPDPA